MRAKFRGVRGWGIRVWGSLGLLLLVGGGVAWIAGARWWAEQERVVEARFAGRLFSVPSRVYGGPLLLYPGLDTRRARLLARLHRLNYHPAAPDAPLEPGTYRVSGARLAIARRPFRWPHRSDPGGRVDLELDPRGRIVRIADAVGAERQTFELEPELIASFRGVSGEDRRLVTQRDVAPALVSAILSIEDQRFHDHGGIDARRILGAMLANLRRGRVVQGGSTITQQLVKNFFLTPERALTRKLREAAMALILERNHDKDEILDAYLNEVYMGQRGSVAFHGMGEAAFHYFAREAPDLDLHECALLAGLIAAPNHFAPRRHPERARARRDLVLRVMLERGEIDQADHARAVASGLGVVPAPPDTELAPYFVEHVRQELARAHGEELLQGEGLAVFTTLDPELQRAANAAVGEGLERLERAHPGLRREASPLQAAVVALAPRTGEILALVGGRSWRDSQFNRATQALRQPGSVFKPIVALAAFTHEQSLPRITPATALEDAPLSFEMPHGTWTPQNYDGEFRGRVSLRRAVEESINVPIARLGLAIGPEQIVDTARRLGVRSPLEPLPSLALGSFELTLLEAATSYAALAAEGVVPAVRGYTEVLHPDGTVLERRERSFERRFDPAAVYLVTSLLQGAVDRGTGRGLRARGFVGDIAGKTGTSSGYRDAWFVGFTPDIVIGVWVGFDDGEGLGLPGAVAALPIFGDVLEAARGKDSGARFARPPGVVEVEIDPESGLRAALGCPGPPEVFLDGTAPLRQCGPARRDGPGPLERLRGWIEGVL